MLVARVATTPNGLAEFHGVVRIIRSIERIKLLWCGPGMIDALLAQARSILEKQFLKNALLPAIVFPILIAVPPLFVDNGIDEVGAWWDAQSVTAKVAVTLAYATLTWFIAAVLASQWRNIIRLYEGYPLARWLPQLDAACKNYHRARLRWLNGRRSWQILYYDYPEDEFDVLPTRLGNILRAAEHHGHYRFGAGAIILWPRLIQVAPREFVISADEARASLEFLLVLSLGSFAFAVLESPLLVMVGASTWVVVLCFLGGVMVFYAAYVSALGSCSRVR